jgi:hypothetical protein
MNIIWINTENGEDKIIAISNEKILKANPKTEKIELCITDIKNDIVNKDVFGIPLSYIKSIQLQENKKYIQVFYGQDSEEYLRINDDAKRKEIFEYFKDNISSTEYRIEAFNNTKSAKKPLIAIVIVIVLFIWTLSVASGVESGKEYEVLGNKRSIASFVLAIAQFGTIKITLAFLLLLGLTTRKFMRNIHNNTNIYIIEIIR